MLRKMVAAVPVSAVSAAAAACLVVIGVVL